MEQTYQSCSYLTVIHNGYNCKSCKKAPIIGTRWFCFQCRKNGIIFNYCSTCYIMEWHMHPLTAIKYSTNNQRIECPDPENDPREPFNFSEFNTNKFKNSL